MKEARNINGGGSAVAPAHRLAVRNLSAWYGQATALFGVDVDVGSGEIVGMLGRNGAGKTTLLRSIARLHRFISGEITFDGRELGHERADMVSRVGISFVREGARLPGTLSVLENIRLGMRLAKLRKKESLSLDEVIGRFPLLAGILKRPTVALSGGQRQTVALAAAFASAPSLLLLDEPSAGLAPVVAESVFEMIGSLAASGLGLLIVEQTPSWLIGRAKRGYLLDVGNVLQTGSIEEIADRVRG